MKVILTGNDMLPKVVCIEDAAIDLACDDSFWDTWKAVELDGINVDVRIIGSFAETEQREIDFGAIVMLEVYEVDSQNKLFECKSPIIEDDYSAELRGEIRDVIVSRVLLEEYGYDGDEPTIEQLRLMSKEILRYWGESGGFANALSFVYPVE